MSQVIRPPVELHRLIFALVQQPDLAKRFRESVDIVYETFEVPKDQRARLKDEPRRALYELGVHPNLQFKFLGACGLLRLAPASIKPYLERRRELHGTNC